MKKVIILLFTVMIISGCSIPEELGIPDFITEFKLNVLSDTYTAADISEENENIASVGDTLRFVKDIHQSDEIGPIEITDTDEKTTDMNLGEFMPEYLHATHGSNAIIDDFQIIPTIKVFDDFEEFESITFHQGTFNISVTNNTSIWGGNAIDGEPLMVDVINNNNGEILQTVVYDDPEDQYYGDIPPGGGVSERNFELAGKTYPTSIKLQMRGGSRGTDGVPALIDTSSTVDFVAYVENAEADSISGASINEQEIDYIENSEEFDIPSPHIVGDFQLSDESSITFDFSPIKIATSLEIEVVGFNDTGDSIALDPVIMELPINEEHTYRELTSDEYNINELISFIPELLDITLYPTVGDGSYVESISSGDSLSVDVNLTADFQINTFGEDIWIIPKEDDEITITTADTEGFDQDIYDTFQSGTLLMKYLNPTGMKLAADLVVSDSKAFVTKQVQNVDNPIDTTKVTLFQIPQMDTSSVTYQNFSIELESTDLEYFLADSVFWAPRFNVISEGNQPWVGGIGMKAELQLELKISENTLD